MKPRTRLQLEVWKLHQKLSEPREQEPFVISNHKHYFTTHYKSIVCLECNHMWKPNQIWHEKVIGVECPNCQKKLNSISTQNGGMATRIITYSVVQVVERFQVVRYFSCWKHVSKNKPPQYSFHALFEEWKDWDKNKSVIIGRTQSWSGDGFSSSTYEVRAVSNSGWRGNPYRSFASDINCPGAQFIPKFKKYKLNSFNHNCDFRFLIEKVEGQSKVETLLKAKQRSLLFHAVHKDSNHNYHSYWPQIKMVIRHKYKITDAGIWYDYLNLLKSFGKDILNPKFVLPKNLKAAHNEYVVKKRIRDERERLKRERERQENERLKAEAEEALKGIKYEVFKNFSFKKGKIKIVCLVEEEDVKKEGETLEHCVYENEYHKKSGILLMSARIDDERIETIEISLATYKIIQCRGFDNKPSQHHDEIINIVKNNLGKLSRIVEKQKKLKQLDTNLSNLENQLVA